MSLRAELKQNYASWAWLTVAVPASPAVIEKANAVMPNFWAQVANTVDYVKVMAYDYHGAWDNPKYTNFNAPLNYDANQPADMVGRATFNVMSILRAYLDAGVSPGKLVMGIPAYGRALSGVPDAALPVYPKGLGLYQKNFLGPWQGGGASDGVYDYKDILGKMLGKGFTDYRIVGVGSAAYNKAEKAWISFDSVNDVQLKADKVGTMGLGGVMVWSLSGDVGITDPNYSTSSLIHTLNTSLNAEKSKNK